MRLKKSAYATGSSGRGGALEFIPMAQLNRPTPAIDGGLAAAAHTHASEATRSRARRVETDDAPALRLAR